MPPPRASALSVIRLSSDPIADDPIGIGEFSQLMQPLGPWPASRRMAVAVSGGADSLCLAWLAARWGRPLALVVDHGLRLDSADEAASTCRRLADLGIESRLLVVHGITLGSGLAERARRARYDALEEAAAQAGLGDLLLGHHESDQAETAAMRQDSGSGPAGLAGMARIFETQGVRLIRPLLGIAARRLRASLRQAGIAWVDDPSNQDMTTARARARATLAASPNQAKALLAKTRLAAATRSQNERRIADILADRARIYPEGFAVLSPGAIEPAALAALVRTVTGSPYPARSTSLDRIAARPEPAVLGGLRILPAGKCGPGWLLAREVAAMAPAIPATHGSVWDRRFRFYCGPSIAGASLGALGEDAFALRRHSDLPACVLHTLPALRLNERLVSVPHIGYPWMLGDVAIDAAGIRVAFAPSNPACGAPFCQ